MVYLKSFKHFSHWQGTEEEIQEALNRSLSRVNQHAQNNTIGLISANLQALTQQDRERNNRARGELGHQIRTAGYGYAHVRGASKEAGEHVSDEPSFMVVGPKRDKKGNFKQFLMKHGQKHGQSSVVYKHPDSENATLIYTRDDPEHGHKYGDEEDLGKWHANRTAAQYFTKLKGPRNFNFEAVEDDMIIVYTNPVSFFSRKESLL